MINIVSTQATSFRTFGWVQDPSNFESLCNVVGIFDRDSTIHQALANEIIPRLVEKRDGRDDLIVALQNNPLKIKYSQLVGTPFKPRSSARCNGIVQAAVKGQIRPFIGDWPADNYVRWAQAFGFIEYNYSDDTFSITEKGKLLSSAHTSSKQLNQKEKDILAEAILAYPPAVRILNLLAETEDTHLTKYDIGKQLGFIGEDGFTSLPQTVLIRALATTKSTDQKNKMKTDWDGSSDKYARMIAKWLQKLGFVKQIAKKVTVTTGSESFSEVIGQAYVITAAGRIALNRTTGQSRYKRIPKNVSYEMMATKGKDREYLRTRRTYILKAISESAGQISYDEIKDFLSGHGLAETINTIKDDIQGLTNIGLNIKISDNYCQWKDKINDFILPLPKKLTKSCLTEKKEKIRAHLHYISHEFLSLIDLAYDSKQNRLFEMMTLQLLTDECNYNGLHLGGSRKPDGIIYTSDLIDNYGVIIDTKAYSGGYSLPIQQADEMERYIRENQRRDSCINANKWWENFDEKISQFFFMFVSGNFIGNCSDKIERIYRSTNVCGTAINVYNLLLCADAIKGHRITHQNAVKILSCNKEFLLENHKS